MKGYKAMSKSSKRTFTDINDHKSVKPRLNDICELLGVESRCHPEKIIIHVYQGANEAGHQWSSFHRATSTLDIDKVVIVYCNIKMVKDNRWNPKDLVDWLLDCDVHFIITHIHQGLEQLCWNMDDLYLQVYRLYRHYGYPNGKHLACPIWTQNKFGYLSAITKHEFCNPTIKVELKADDLMDYTAIKATITNNLLDHLEGVGYVVKTPFTTNRSNFCKARDESEVIDKIKLLHKKLKDKIPYVMVQVCMKNAREYKCVLFNGRRQYLAYNCSRIGTPYSDYPHHDIFDFAELAVHTLAAEVPAAILDSLVRVDIFKRQNGSLVVNEFESFEADHHTASRYNSDLQFILDSRIDLIYKELLCKYVDKSYRS